MKEPLMPKGVEHLGRLGALVRQEKVKEPLMPKGVEHGNLARDGCWLSEGERTFDAERR